jgi:hypothetical protein
VQQQAYEATFLVNSTSVVTAKMLEVDSYGLRNPLMLNAHAFSKDKIYFAEHPLLKLS